MRLRVVTIGLIAAVWVLPPAGAVSNAGPIPPGRQHRLTIEGESTVTFIPQAGLPPFQIAYQAKIEYIVNTRFGKESKPSTEETQPSTEETSPEKTTSKTKVSSGRTKPRKGEGPASKVSGAVDLSLHSSEMSLRQNGQAVLETKITRSRFQGRIQPDSPVMSVTANEAPPRLQEILKTFDTLSATMSINDNYKVINRKFRFEGPQRAVTETILSIHAPIPKGEDSWEAPTQLAMGQGQTAKGNLRFEKEKVGATKPGGSVKVKVSGVLKAEGIVAGRFIKDGTYTVAGEQTYDSHTNEWTSSRWSVVVANELANPAGQTVAHVRGTMTVQSRALEGGAAPAVDVTAPKP